ncbi:HesB/IscA family protein [Marinicella rhabdoformis]|uniref:HesB/IscA family protein n=1 Tax=Marinicella rhabdoformis TaxID=2580566 RepID=UPI0012AED571|nr:iron-sulfur cluster assembly accessory protein [Marinicella rhabdoformis]
MTLQLTETAAARIAHFLSLDENAKGFRVAIKKMGCSGWGYDVSIAQNIESDDVLLEDKGITLIVPKDALEKIEGTTIDYQKQGINQIFVYENPNATGECGCGESFTTN